MSGHSTAEHNGIQAASEPPIGTQLTQARSAPVHPFSSDIRALDCKMRREKDGHIKLGLEHGIWLLREAPESPNAKRYIGRQIAVSNGTYKPPKPVWLDRALHLDAVRQSDGGEQ